MLIWHRCSASVFREDGRRSRKLLTSSRGHVPVSCPMIVLLFYMVLPMSLAPVGQNRPPPVKYQIFYCFQNFSLPCCLPRMYPHPRRTSFIRAELLCPRRSCSSPASIHRRGASGRSRRDPHRLQPVLHTRATCISSSPCILMGLPNI